MSRRLRAVIAGTILILAARAMAASGPEAIVPGPAQSLPPAAPGAYPLSLDEAKQRAVGQNKKLNLARLNVQEKFLAIAAAKTDYLPKILGNVDYFHFNQNLGKVATLRTGRFGILPPTTRSFFVNAVNQNSTLGALTLAQPITKLILVNAAVRVAKADASIAEAQLDKGTHDLLSGVAQAFYALHGAQRIESALALQVSFAQQFGQATPKPEVRIALIEAQQALAQVRGQIADLTEQLDNLLEFPAGTRLMAVDPMPPAAPVHSADEAAALALACNPEVREAFANVDKGMAALKAARADFLPDISVFGSYFNQTALQVIPSNIGAIGVTASYTFLDWGKRRHVKAQREMQIAMAQLNVQATRDKVALEARQAYIAYEQAQQALALAAELIQARKDAEAELKDPVALQAAKAATAKAELEAMQAEISYRIAYSRLSGAIGQD